MAQAEQNDALEHAFPKVFVSTLVEMGFPKNQVLWSLHFTGCKSVEDATTWLFENSDNPKYKQPFVLEKDHKEALFPLNFLQKMTSLQQELKLVFVVRTDLRMGVGKVAAQCAHATLGVYRLALAKHRDTVDAWMSAGQKKIVLRVNGLEALQDLERAARAAGLCTFVCRDAGKTQVAPGSLTVLAIGPAPSAQIDQITGRLTLL